MLTFDFGLNETEATQQTEAQEGYNFDLELGAKRLFPRKPIDLKGTVPNAGSVNAILQLVKRDDSETTLIMGDATTPTLYSWTGTNTTTAFTSERTTNIASTSMLRGTYWSLDDHLVITDLRKLTPLLNWDGSSVTRQKTALGGGTAKANTGISEAAGTYTVLTASHGYSVGDTVIIAGTDNASLHGEHEVTSVPSAGAWQYVDTAGLGGTTSTHGTSELTVELFAKYGIVHNGRMWLFNVKDGSNDNPHMILASAFEDHESYDTVNRSGVASGNAAFYTLTPDLKPINGAWVFNKQLIISTVDGALHRLSGVDAADYQFTTYFAGSAAIGEESGANIGNDVIYMRKSGNIDLLTTTDRSGDVRADDISRYIPDTTKDLTGSLVVYDQKNQKVLFFLDNKVIVLFKDILATGGGSPWSVYKTSVVDSNGGMIFTTKAASYIRRPGESSYSVYFGDADGNIYDLNGAGTGDNGTDIIMSRKTPLIETTRLSILRGNIQYRRLGQMVISLIFDWSNEYNETQCDITLKGPSSTDAPNYYGGAVYYGGTFYYNEGFAFDEKVSKQNFSPAGRADGFFLTLYTETDVQYQIDNIKFL